MFTKRQLFLSTTNQRFICNDFYRRHIADGGKQPAKYFFEVVPVQMKSWPGIVAAESYETVDGDQLSELQTMNSDFAKEKYLLWRGTGTEEIKIPLHVEDWRPEHYGAHDAPKREATTISNAFFKNNNRPKVLQQTMHSRPLDRANEGMAMYRSMGTFIKSMDMSRILSAIKRPYKTVATLDVTPSYNSELDSSRALSATGSD